MTTKTDTPALCVGCQLPVFEEARLLTTIATAGRGTLCRPCEDDFLGTLLGAPLKDWRREVALHFQPPTRGVGPMRCEPWRAKAINPPTTAHPPWQRDDGDAWRERIRGWLIAPSADAAAIRQRQGVWLEEKHAAERAERARANAAAEKARKQRALEAREAQLKAEQERARKELEELKASKA